MRFALCSFLACTCLLLAEEPLVAVSASTSEEPVYDLEKIVVTPSRTTARPWLTTPQAAAVVTDTKLGATAKVNLEDYLRDIPGVGMAPSGGTGQTSLNTSNRNSDYWNDGFSIRGLGAQRVLVLTDGVRQSGQGTGYGGGNLSLYDLLAIDRVEVLKGPGSVLYGTDAFGGVIQVFSRDPKVRDTFGVNGRARLSFDGSRNAWSAGEWTDVGGEGWGLVAGLSRTEAEAPHLPNGTTADGGAYKKTGAFFKYAWRPNDETTVRVLGNRVEADDIVAYSEPFLTGEFYFKIPYYERDMVGAEVEQHRSGELLSHWKTGLYTQELHRRLWRSTPIMPPMPYAFDVVHTRDRVTTSEWQSSADLDLGAHTLTLGSDLGLDTAFLTEDALTTGTAVRRVKADAEQKRAGLYAQDLWKFGAEELTAGARWDTFGLTDNLYGADDDLSGWSGSLSLAHRLTNSSSLYATVGDGFRSPDLDERYQNTVMKFFNQQVTVEGNPDLDPERALSVEAGFKHESPSWGHFEAALYHTSIDDFIGEGLVSSTTVGSTTTIVKQKQNLGDVALYGAEAAWHSAPESPWKNYLSVSRTLTDSPKIVALPHYQISWGVGKSLVVAPFDHITPSLSGRIYTSCRDSVADVNFPFASVIDAQVAFDWKATSDLRAQWVVGVKNIFDRAYYTPFYDSLQPCRGVFTSLQFDF
jgi:hemoglobin/transferrin/lactoferrin receptor protein